MQKRCNSIANAMELRLFRINPSILLYSIIIRATHGHSLIQQQFPCIYYTYVSTANVHLPA